jgi:uncharacterized protein
MLAYTRHMVRKKYQSLIKNVLNKHFSKHAKMFIFGSSIRGGQFYDIDVGIEDACAHEMAFFDAREELEESTIPYFVDIIDLNKADAQFRNAVLNDKILWLTSKRN